MLEYERLKQNDLFTKIKRNTISEDTLTVFFHNVRSLSKHVNGILGNDRIMDDEITEWILRTNPMDITPGDFNYGFLKVSENKLLDIFIDHI